MSYVVYQKPLECEKCTRYGNDPGPPLSICNSCQKNSKKKVEIVKYGKIFSRIIFEDGLASKIVLSSRLHKVVE